MTMNTDKGKKTVKGYWDSMWGSSDSPNSIDPHDLGLRNYATRMFHRYFRRVFSTLDKGQTRLLEIGCANSVWLPYFNKEFGFEVTGLDYSEIGCDKARQNLDRDGVNGEVVYADLFSPPSHMLGRYDVVVSFGVAEHFDDTSKCLVALSKFLTNGGLLITIIPNMAGLLGFVQKHINRPVFEIHNPLTNEQFISANEIEGYEIVECDYFMSTNFGVVNLNGIRKGTLKWLVKRIILVFFVRFSMLIWLIEEKIGMFPVSRLFSPYINCVVIKDSIHVQK